MAGKRTHEQITLMDNTQEEYDQSDWSREELQLFDKLISDMKHFEKVKTLSAILILKIAALPLYYWKNGDFHPLLICKCSAPMRCRYLTGPPPKIMFGCSLWSSQASKAHEQALAMHKKSNNKNPPPKLPYCEGRLFELDCKKILDRIEATLGRPRSMRQFFCPMAVRMAQHVGFGLVNHTPPLANKNRWRLYDRLFCLTDRPDAVSIPIVKDWNACADDPPNPSLFEGFEPDAQEKACIRQAVAQLLSKNYVLAYDRVLDFVTPMTEPKDALHHKTILQSLKGDSLLVVNVPLLTKMTQQYDYLMYIGKRRAIPTKVLQTWANGQMVALPLHGMGKNDLGFLYGSSQLVLFLYEGETLFLDTSLLAEAAFKLDQVLPFKSFVRPPAPIKMDKMDINVLDEMGKNDSSHYASDVEWHDATSSDLQCGPHCLGEEASKDLQKLYDTPGDLEQLPTPTGVYKTSITEHKASDVHLIFEPRHFVEWCKTNQLCFTFFAIE